jgi:uncharacterized protein YndB with AHSA1/START domain
MSVVGVEKNPEALTMTVAADLDVTVERAWQLRAHTRQFEKWWGPRDYPATEVDLDLHAGRRITFVMVGPDNGRHNGTWEVFATAPPP